MDKKPNFSKIQDNMTDENISELLLGTQAKPNPTKKYLGKIIPILIVIVTYIFILKSKLPKEQYLDAQDRLLGISILGLLTILFSKGLGNYKGPSTFFGGSMYGLPIDKTSPKIAVEFLGWVIILVTLLVALGYYLNP